MSDDPKTQNHLNCAKYASGIADTIIMEATREKTPEGKQEVPETVTFVTSGIFSRDVVEKYAGEQEGER